MHNTNDVPDPVAHAEEIISAAFVNSGFVGEMVADGFCYIVLAPIDLVSNEADRGRILRLLPLVAELGIKAIQQGTTAFYFAVPPSVDSVEAVMVLSRLEDEIKTTYPSGEAPPLFIRPPARD